MLVHIFMQSMASNYHWSGEGFTGLGGNGNAALGHDAHLQLQVCIGREQSGAIDHAPDMALARRGEMVGEELKALNQYHESSPVASTWQPVQRFGIALTDSFTMPLSVGTGLWASALSGAVFVVVAIVRFLLQTRRPHGFPPGPPTTLGLGNLHQVPPGKPFLKFDEWSKEYGDIIGLKMGPKNFVILCNPCHARELFAKRGAKYSGRPHSAVAMEHVVQPPDKHLLFLPYDGFLKRWRAAVRHILSPEGVAKLGPLQSALGTRLAHDLLQNPNSWRSSIGRWGLETPMLSSSSRHLGEM